MTHPHFTEPADNTKHWESDLLKPFLDDHADGINTLESSVSTLQVSADSTASAASTAQKASGFQVVRRPYQLTGIAADGTTDDAVALQAALSAMKPYDVALLPPGATIKHSSALTMNVPNVTLRGMPGSKLLGSAASGALKVQANGITLESVVHEMYSQGARDGLDFSHAPFLIGLGDDGSSGLPADATIYDITLRNCVARYSQSASFFWYNVQRLVSDNNVAGDGLADAHHFTGGCKYGRVINPVATDCFDDGVALVSYLSNPVKNSDFIIYNPKVTGGNHGRGITVLGADNVRIMNPDIQNVGAAGIYLGIEGGGATASNTYASSNIRVSGGQVVRANYTGAADNGSILVLTANNLNADKIVVEDVRIIDSNPVRGAVNAKQHTLGGGTITNSSISCTLEGEYSETFAVNNALGTGITMNVTQLGHRFELGSAAPTTGPHFTGQRVWNKSTTSGQPQYWVCTGYGTPGTWVAGPNNP